jgi:hypothetical protein
VHVARVGLDKKQPGHHFAKRVPLLQIGQR